MRLVSLLVGEWRVTDTFLYSKSCYDVQESQNFPPPAGLGLLSRGLLSSARSARRNTENAADHKLECVRPY